MNAGKQIRASTASRIGWQPSTVGGGADFLPDAQGRRAEDDAGRQESHLGDPDLNGALTTLRRGST
jgi:hypothetical protein